MAPIPSSKSIGLSLLSLHTLWSSPNNNVNTRPQSRIRLSVDAFTLSQIPSPHIQRETNINYQQSHYNTFHRKTTALHVSAPILDEPTKAKVFNNGESGQGPAHSVSISKAPVVPVSVSVPSKKKVILRPNRNRRIRTTTTTTARATNNNVSPTKPAYDNNPQSNRKSLRLTREEEIAYTKDIKTLKSAIRIRDELAKAKTLKSVSRQSQNIADKIITNNRPYLPFKEGPTEQEWATSCNLTVIQLRRIVVAGREARAKLVAGNVGLVLQVAKRYFYELKRSVDGGGSNGVGTILTLQDMVQEGNLGLMEAAERFDSEKNVRFGTYAQYWVRQRILRSIADNSRVIRLPVHVHTTLRNIRKTKADMEKEIGRTPSLPELAQRLDMSPEKVQLYTDSSRTVLSLEVPLSGSKSTKAGGAGGAAGEEDKRTLGERIPSDFPTPQEDAESHALKQDIRAAIDGLGSERERDVLVLRFGLDDGNPKTFEETAQRLGISRDRVRMLEARALNKLRHPQRNYRLKEYVGEHSCSEQEGNDFHNSIYGFSEPIKEDNNGNDAMSTFSPEQIWSF